MKKLPGLYQRGPTVLALSITLLFSAGCKNFFPPNTTTGTTTTTPTNTGDYAYVASVNTASSTNPIYTLSGFSVGTGTLTALSGFPLTLPFAPATVVVAPSNALLYVSGSAVLYGYTLSSAGALTSILNTNQQQALINANIISMVVSPDGKWLLALDSTLNSNIVTIDEYAISSSGQLTAATGAQYAPHRRCDHRSEQHRSLARRQLCCCLARDWRGCSVQLRDKHRGSNRSQANQHRFHFGCGPGGSLRFHQQCPLRGAERDRRRSCPIRHQRWRFDSHSCGRCAFCAWRGSVLHGCRLHGQVFVRRQ